MIRTVITLCFSLAVILANGQTQRYQNRELALITFNFNIAKDIKPIFDTQSQLFPEVENRKVDKVIALLKERTWYLLEARLEQEIGMYILPVNAYGKSFKYDEYNFPSVSINQALKRGTSKYYMRVDISIISAIEKRDAGYGASIPTSDSIASKLSEMENACLPKITIDITTYNDKGILPLQKISATITAKDPWVLGEDIFNGLVNKKEFDRQSTNTYLGLTNVAISRLIRNF